MIKVSKYSVRIKNVIFILIFVVFAGLFLKWLFDPAETVGESVPIQSRDHIKVGENHPSYNSNPPTSGWHYETPVAAGIYDSARPDESLIHSLEHGYVVVSYNCQKARSFWPTAVYAHEEGQGSASATPETSPSAAAAEDCRKLRADLRNLAERLKSWKLIVIPRTNLDTRLALTAWGRVDKFNLAENSALAEAEKKRIERFVNLYRDQGPEKTGD